MGWLGLAGGILQAQTLDSLNPGANGAVYALALQPDGKVLVGGGFTTVGSQTHWGLARLDDAGVVDSSFTPQISMFPPGGSVAVKALAVQPDGGIVVAGYFYTLCGQVRNSLGRLNSDATLDLAFSPSPNGAVAALAVQADGKILAGGSFTTLLGQSRSHLGRLNADGSLDTNFNVVVNNTVNTIALQPDGKILLGGSFTQVGTQSHINLARVNSNGSLDTSFTAAASNPVNAIVLQPDGKILVGGDFTLLANQSRPYLGRLNTNGVLDTGFTAAVTVPVQSLALQGDGKIIVSTNGSNLGRLNADGTSDSTFLPASSTNGVVYALALDLEGRAMVGGQFSNLGGQARSNLCRLTASAPATRTLSFDGSTVTWLRGGTSPEIWRANFEASTNGENWINLGDAVHASTGWQLGGLALPSNATIHARGFITSGRQNGSGWVTEASVGAPGVTRQPANRTNNAGTQASFQVEAVGTAPLGYQWRKGGTNLVDSLNVSGTRTPTLTLSNVSVAQAGGYSVVISNAVGNATSRVAALSVADPFILGQPTNQAANAGQSITFRVTAGGTGPLSYQWRKDGALLGPATAAVLTVTNTQWHDRGSYDVVVTGPFGSATSTVATLTVNLAAPDEFNPGPGGIVFALGEQTDGKILLGGAFTSLGGQSQWYRLGRVNRNGSLDTNFHPYAEYYVYSLVVQPDGKIVVGGTFGSLGEQPCSNLGRLNADGTFDTDFDGGANNWVNCVALQPDGKIVVGGGFSSLASQPRTFIGRLNPDHTLDTAFNPSMAGNEVYCVAVQPDGKILVGGIFSALAGQTRSNIGRLYANGSPDTTFNPGADGEVDCFALQADGKILVGGKFANLGGQPRSRIVRLLPDGTVDSTFNPGADNYVMSIAVQADGKIQVGGGFRTLGGLPRASLGRLNADGTVDPFFNPGSSGNVYALAIQSDGKTVVGGPFQSLAGVQRADLGRLGNIEPATQSLAFDGETATWNRGGSSPETWCASFEVSTNGTDWSGLGCGTRIPGGWQLNGLSQPAYAGIRARGFVTGGYCGGSSWLVESTLPPRPVLVTSASGFAFHSNRFGFHVAGLMGQTVVVEASSNLLDWVTLQTNTLGADPLFFNDPGSTDLAWRFYRARLQ